MSALLVDDEDGAYVRPECSQGFTADQCRAIHAMKERIRNGECIETEAAVHLARMVLDAFGTRATPAPAVGDGRVCPACERATTYTVTICASCGEESLIGEQVRQAEIAAQAAQGGRHE